jgi:hypothetical protein
MHHPHGAAAHAATEQVGHDRPHLGRVHPVVGRPGVDLALGTNECPGLDTRHIGRIGQRQVGVGVLVLVQTLERAGFDQLLGKPLPLLIGPVREDHLVRLGELGDLRHPGQQALVVRRRGIQTGNGR